MRLNCDIFVCCDIILLIDCNENLTKNHDLQQHLTTEPILLIDPIRLRHGDLNNLPPTTDKGSYPIDAIFVSPEIADIIAGGWLQMSNGISDHRPLFIDISIQQLLGKFKNSTQPYTIRRLKCKDKKAVDKYNSILEQQYMYHNTIQKLKDFRSSQCIPLSDQNKTELLKIDRVSTQAVVHAERHCRKIHAGGKSYTPKLNQLGRTIDVWRLIV